MNMQRDHRAFFYRVFVFVVGALLASPLPAKPLGPEELLALAERPSIFDTVAARSPALESLAARGQGQLPSLILYENIVAKVLPLLGDHDVYLLARDMDYVKDSIEVVLFHAGILPETRKYLHRLVMSRLVSEQTSSPVLRSWLERSNFRYDTVLRGKRKTFLFDNGYRSHALSRLFFELCTEATRDGLLAQLFTQVTPRLISSHGSVGYEPIAAAPSARTCEEFRYWRPRENYSVRFPELFSPAEIRNTGMPEHELTRVDWLIENWDRLNRHWAPRIAEVHEDGTYVFDRESYRDARVDRPMVVQTQLALWDYFSREDVLARLLPLLEPVFAQLLQQSSPQGKRLWRTPGGLLVELGPVLESDALFLVQRGTLRPSGLPVVLKTANPLANGEATTAIESDLRYGGRLRDLQQAHTLPFAVPQVLETGTTFVLKTWIEGTRGDQWLRDWTARGAPSDDVFLQALGRTVRSLVQTGTYVRKLEPQHVLYANGVLALLGSGGLNDGGPSQGPLPAGDVVERYRKSFTDRWGQEIPAPCSAQLLRALGLEAGA